MRAITAIGIAVAFAGLILGVMLEGGSITAFFNVPAILIVLVGTLGVTMASTDFAAVRNAPGLVKRAVQPPELELRARADLLTGFAERARREGLLALEDGIAEVDDAFTRKGLQLVVDATDPELAREILETEIDGMSARHAKGRDLFEKGGGFAPTLGIIGTVMSLVHVLQNLSQPETLGPMISGAFMATLYGVGAANLFLLPIASKLAQLSKQEAELRTMTVEGVLAVQAGENPRTVGERLLTFVPPAEREVPRRAGDVDGSGAAQRAETPIAA